MPDTFHLLLHQNLAQLRYILPELMVVATFLLALVFDLAVAAERRKSTGYVCLVGLLVALWLVLLQHQQFIAAAAHGGVTHKPIFAGMLSYDEFGTFFRFILLVGTMISLLLALHARELFGRNHGEFYLLLVAVCAGGMFLASATNLLMIYLAIESLSIVSYALAGFLRRDRKSAEAGIKYVIYGAMSSGLMLFGMSYLYGLTGTLSLLDSHDRNGAVVQGIASHVMSLETPLARGGLACILVLLFSGFLYKIAAVPFHYWSPDVYEGAPTTATGFFSVVPKAAGFAVLIRTLCAFFPLGHAEKAWLSYPRVEQLVAVIAVLSMVVGNLAALGQSNAKRMLAYSSIAHAGYMLAGLSVLDDTVGPASVLFYLLVYMVMNLGAFLVLIALENVFGGSELRQLRGAGRREPLLCVMLCVFLFSLVGMPPLGGFIGKYLIMWKLAARGNYGMIFWIGFNSVISLYYYMRLAKAVVLDQPEEAVASTEKTPVSYSALAVCQGAALLLLFFCFEPVQRLCLQAMAPLR
ncbi:MAG: NADH-quinone oxidoreductase subunit N [Planctomycetota bacterium]|nr:NADH-quinone oxidoreductase subunit N [Planctomycetota bacterium]